MIKTIILLIIIIYGICGILGFFGFIVDVIKWHLPENKEDIISSAKKAESEVLTYERRNNDITGRSDNTATGADTGTRTEYHFDFGTGNNNDNNNSIN